jgi:hypothetical protein
LRGRAWAAAASRVAWSNRRRKQGGPIGGGSRRGGTHAAAVSETERDGRGRLFCGAVGGVSKAGPRKSIFNGNGQTRSKPTVFLTPVLIPMVFVET